MATRIIKKDSVAFFNNKKLFFLTNTNKVIKVSHHTKKGFEQALKLHITKSRFDIFSNTGSDKVDCCFCGNHNSTWFPLYELKGKEITVTSVGYRKPIFFCYSNHMNKCDGKQLNPNSVAFVSRTRAIESEEETLKIIRERNASPFYAENHDSYEDYTKYQANLFYGRCLDKVQAGLLRAAQTKLKNCTTANGKKTAYSYITETSTGMLLNSNGERYFYSLLEKYGISSEVKSNGFYEGSILMYDFYFPKINQYVEIAGMNYEKYNVRIEEKKSKFGSLVLHGRKDYKKFEQTVLTIKEKLLNANTTI